MWQNLAGKALIDIRVLQNAFSSELSDGAFWRLLGAR
jgi:hypothetical protein